MRPRAVPLTAALLAVAVVVGSASAATPAAGGTPISLVITVKSVTTSIKRTDKPPKGASKGDRYVYRDRLVNVARQFGKPKGASVGRDAGSLTLTSSSTGVMTGVATLPGGTIRFGGKIGSSPAPFSVLGGTGRYAHARGVLIVGAGSSPLNIYRLTFPASASGATV
jgi:hypothetical protein